MTHTLQQSDLYQFTGSDHWYRHWAVRNVLFTDGAHHVADKGGAFWLIDEIALAQRTPEIKAEEFQVWRLVVQPDHTATLSCEDGNGNTVFAKTLKFTDFPLPSIELWFENKTIYLPSER